MLHLIGLIILGLPVTSILASILTYRDEYYGCVAWLFLYLFWVAIILLMQ